VEAVLYGGPGDDRLKGGGGRTILVGCEGDDELLGGNQGDLMIGGTGADRLVGGNGTDILVAGILADSADDEDDNYDDLVTVLTAGVIPAPLKAMDDGAVDKLTGGGESDTFYYNFVGGGILDILTGGWEHRFDI
jgi:Ca2+-binding RTX toxin-like protein